MIKQFFAMAICGICVFGAAAQYAPATEGKVFKYTSEITEPEHKTIEYTETVNSVTTNNGKTTVTATQAYKAVGLENLPDQKITYTFTTPEQPTVIALMDPASLREMIENSIRQEAVGVSMDQLQQVLDMIKTSGKMELKLDPAAAAGSKLPASSMRISVGQMMSMGVYLSNGKYEGTESVTVPAGTFDNCLKVTYIFKQNMGTESEKRYVTAWYAPGVGLVKEVNADKKGVVTETTQLTAIE